MNAQSVLSKALAQGIVLYVEDQQLKFKANKGALTEALKQELKQNKQELIEYLVAAKTAVTTTDFMIQVSPEEQKPLSYAQQSLWIAHELQGGSQQFNMTGRLIFRGDFNQSIFEQALRKTILRHQVLRTKFLKNDLGICQVCVEAFDLPITRFDLSDLTDNQKFEAIRNHISSENTLSFDLESDLMIRVRELKLETDHYVLLYTIHHIASDGWSMAIFNREFSEIYNNLKSGINTNLPNLAVQYGDFAVWQRKAIDQGAFDYQMAYWQKQLQNLPAVHTLPLKGTREKYQSFDVKSLKQVISKDTAEKLSSLCEQQNCTMFMLLQTAFAVLLSKFGSCSDIVMGTPISGRNTKQVEPLMGLFLNSLVLRTQVNKDCSFADTLQLSKEIILEAFSHQDIPFEKLVEILSPQRSLSYSPMFQIWFVFQNNERVSLSLGQQELEKQKLDDKQSDLFESKIDEAGNHDLSLYLRESEAGIQCTWRYQTALFDSSTISYLTKQFELLLISISQNIFCPIKQLNIFSSLALQRNNLSNDLDDTSLWYRNYQSVIERFDHIVNQCPDKQALSDKNTKLSYRELQKLSSDYCYSINRHAKGDIIGLMFPHQADMVVAIIAALKAGKTYVPMDASYPPERLRYMLRDAEIDNVFTCNELEIFAKNLIEPDQGIEIFSFQSESENVVYPLESKVPDIAYILYTSGSTGQPKGVMQSQQNILYFINNYVAGLEINSDDKLLQVASFNFDASVMDLYSALLTGASLYLLDIRDTGPNEFAALISEQEISIYHSTPTALKYLAEASNNTSFDNVRAVVMGGETLDGNVLRIYKSLFTEHSQLLNGYGPTESTLALQEYIPYADVTPSNKPALGRAIYGTSVTVMTSNEEPADAYEPGEIVIQSEHLALGYRNLPSLTKEKFKDVKHGYRSYYTGDIGRVNALGKIEFLGRVDNQVKLRGIRIELDDIETQLHCMESIADAAVVTDLDKLGEPQLVAFYVTKQKVDGHLLSQFELDIKKRLSTVLPDYMVPHFYHSLEHMPTTNSGKIDRKALPSITELLYLDKDIQAPDNDTERRIVDIWTDLLKIDRQISIDDNFFHVGGHSLLATRLVSALRQEFDIEINLRTIFDKNTIRDQALEIIHCNPTSMSNVIPTLSAKGAEVSPLSYAQQRLWFIDQLSGGSSQYNMTGKFTIADEFNQSAFESAIATILTRHEALRTCFSMSGSDGIQIVQKDYELPIRYINIIDEPQELQSQIIKQSVREQNQQLFDLTKDLMVRFTVVNVTHQRHIIVYTMHHIASDAWSIEILRRECLTMYQSNLTGVTQNIPDLPVQYSDFAQWQRAYLEGGELESQLNYWQDALQGIPSTHNVPLDYSRPSEQVFSGHRHHISINAALTEQINTYCKANSVTLFMFLETVFAILLYRYSGDNDVVVSTPVAGRTHQNVESLIGFFINNLVIRNQLSEEQTFVELLNKNKNVILDAFANQSIPFELLVDELCTERHLSYNPIAQLSFVLQNTDKDSFESYRKGNASDVARHLNIEDEPINIHYDMVLTAIEQGSEILLGWAYNSSLFKPDSITRIANNYLELIVNLINETAKNKLIRDIDFLDAKQKKQIEQRWSKAFSSYEKQLGVHQIFEQNVAKYPDVVALTHGARQITYDQLNQHANQVAHFLLEQGVTSGSKVGICLERTIEMAIGMMAILKAGACYVPFDPEYPESRIETMIEQSQCRLVLTESSLMEELSVLSMIRAVPLENRTYKLFFGQFPVANPTCAAKAFNSNSLAYIIFTSGSTGKPKGAQVSHRNVTSLVAASNQLEVSRNDVMAQLSNNSFDAITYELWAPLLNGARAVIIDRDQYLEPNVLAEHIQLQKINTLFITTALFNKLILEIPFIFSNMAKVMFGGEAFSPQAIELALNDPPLQLFHVYGPTECTTFATCHQIQKEVFLKDRKAPIGAPLPNNEIYVLHNEKPVPVGVTGELYIGGDGVSRGYLNNPSLTASKFTPSPYSIEPGERLYKTGDLVRFTESGALEFVGRVDQQIKLRGFRVELTEIENAIEQHTLIEQAVVVLRQRPEDTSKYLVAYLLLKKEEIDTPEDIEAQLLQQLHKILPSHMVPAAYVAIEKMPLTPNKKVDKDALPQPDESAFVRYDYVAPKTETEEKLGALWRQSLQLEQVGVLDNYFSIGGDSIKSISLVSVARESGINFAVKDLFIHPTIRELACAIENGDVDTNIIRDIAPYSLIESDEKDLVFSHFKQDEIEDIYPMSVLQQGMIFHSMQARSGIVYNDILAYSLKLPWDEKVFVTTFNHLVSRHPLLRTVFYFEAKKAYQVVYKTLQLDYKIIDLREELEESKSKLISAWFEQTKKNQISITGFPWQITLHVVSDQELFFGMKFHHALWDGWSNATLISEFIDLYNHVLEFGHTKFSQDPPHYRHFIALEQQALEDASLKDFWRRKFDGASLPWWTMSAKQKQESFVCEVTSEDSIRLIELAKELGVQEKSIWFTVYMTLISLLNGKGDVTGSVVVHGRPDIQRSEKTIGLFLNTLPVRVLLNNKIWSTLIREMDQELTEIQKLRNYPLLSIQQDTGLDFSGSMFNYTNFHVYKESEVDTQVLAKGGHEENNYKFSFQVSKDASSNNHRVYININSLLFDKVQVRAINQYVQNIVKDIIQNTDREMRKTLFLTDEQKKCLISTRNSTDSHLPKVNNLIELVQEQFANRPDAVAMVIGAKHLSYGALLRNIDTCAMNLTEMGITQGSLVGLSFDRESDILVAMLSVLKIGAAFVPLDPDFPYSRLEYIINDSGIENIITTKKIAKQLTGLKVAKEIDANLFIDIEQLRQLTTSSTPKTRLMPNSKLNIAYILYTSGSTGKPKGVKVSHASVINFLLSMMAFPGIKMQDRFLGVTTYSFDIALLELLLPVCTGACAVFASAEQVKDGLLLGQEISDNKITMMQATPITWKLLLESGWNGKSDLKALIGGEALASKLAEEIKFKVKSVWNMYGPTETTIWSSTSLFSGTLQQQITSSAEIGRPIFNTSMYVLDEQLELCPPCVIGELYIGGKGLSSGYHNKASLTAGKFVPDFLGNKEGERLYRTGDLVRILDTGQMEFIGRMDAQVKIRGYRIELAEIELVSMNYVGISDAAAHLITLADSDHHLAIYIVLDSKPHETEDSTKFIKNFKEYLAKSLPDYMMPKHVQMIDSIPLTLNGKLNRAALPSPTTMTVTQYEAPRNGLEVKLASLWSSVLEVERVGIDDDFFELGGHSLTATRLVNQLRMEFEISINLIFTHRTVRNVSRELAEQVSGQTLVQSSNEDIEEIEI